MIKRIDTNKEKKIMLAAVGIGSAIAGSLITWLIVWLFLWPQVSPAKSSTEYVTTTVTAINNTTETSASVPTSQREPLQTTTASQLEPSPQPAEPDLSIPTDRRTVVIARRLLPSIVGIRVESDINGTAFSSISEGSGVVYSADGLIITNNHLVSSIYDSSGQIRNQASVKVFLNEDNSPYEAVVLGRDVSTDLAVLKINVAGLQPAEFGDSDQLEIGENVIAIGSPSGLQLMGSVTAGIISGLDRQVRLEDGTTMALIQTDAAVNTGNSGGALINEHGLVIGINNAGLVKNKYEGINFAIPANTVVKIADQLKSRPVNYGTPWLGLTVISDEDYGQLAELYDWPSRGVCIHEVQSDSPAETAGLQPGDLILGFNGSTVVNTTDMTNQIRKMYAGQRLEISVYRPQSEENLIITVILGEKLTG